MNKDDWNFDLHLIKKVFVKSVDDVIVQLVARSWSLNSHYFVEPFVLSSALIPCPFWWPKESHNYTNSFVSNNSPWPKLPFPLFKMSPPLILIDFISSGPVYVFEKKSLFPPSGKNFKTRQIRWRLKQTKKFWNFFVKKGIEFKRSGALIANQLDVIIICLSLSRSLSLSPYNTLTLSRII